MLLFTQVKYLTAERYVFMDMAVSDSLFCAVHADASLSYELCFDSEVIFVSAAMHTGDVA